MLSIVQGLYVSLIEDLQHMHPSIARDLSRDLSRLLDGGIKSGLKLYTITLPSVSKYLLGSLDCGALLELRPPLCGAKSKTDRRPTFLYGLWCAIFESDGTLKSMPDTQSIASVYQVCNLMKKLRIECDERYKLEAIGAFREIERSLPASWDGTWDLDDPNWCTRSGHPIWGPERVDDRQASLLDAITPMHGLSFDPDWKGFRNFVARFSSELGDLHSATLSGDNRLSSLRPQHGPGAVSDKTRYTKYDGKYWTHRLESVFPYDYWASPSLDVPAYVSYMEHASRLHAVLKDQKGPRLIAAEPTSHQWIQGYIRKWLEVKLESSILANTIDFKSQAASQQLALLSSASRSHATIDLSSASDRLTTRLVEYVFQGNRTLLDALAASRTRCVQLPDGELIRLRKFATQGSAVTFPVQSIVFALIAIWAVGLVRHDTKYDSLRSYARTVRVFGDDIIIPNDAYEVCTGLIETCCLKVNASKSYSLGFFRESCGMDAYGGVDVTPTYIREVNSSTPTALESIVECSNNLHLAGYWRTADRLLKTLPPSDIAMIPTKATSSGAFALVSFLGHDPSYHRVRWNRHLHREEILALSLQSAVKRARGRGHGDLLQFFIEEPDQSLPYEGGQSLRPKHRKVLGWADPHDFM